MACYGNRAGSLAELAQQIEHFGRNLFIEGAVIDRTKRLTHFRHVGLSRRIACPG